MKPEHISMLFAGLSLLFMLANLFVMHIITRKIDQLKEIGREAYAPQCPDCSKCNTTKR